MSAETDIAAIDDGGANTASEVRTALTSVLARADTLLNIKTTADDPPDDEFDDSIGMSGATNGLDAKWTAVAGSPGTISILESGTVAKYDLATRDGWLLIQAGTATGSNVLLRQDYTLGDGDCIIMAAAFAVTDPEHIDNNELVMAVYVNDTDSDFNAGNAIGIGTEMDAGETNIKLWKEGSTVYGASNVFGGSVGQLLYLRINRSGTTYYGFYSMDGATWVPLGYNDITAAATNIWIVFEAGATLETPLPVMAVQWLRLGSGTFDPW